MSLASPTPLSSSSKAPARSICCQPLLKSPDLPLFPVCPQQRQRQHRQENRNQSHSGFQRAALPLWQNRKSSVNKFDVHPIHQQRSIPKLDDRAETFLCESPPAPPVNQKKNYQQNAAAHQQEIRIAVPIIVNGVKPHARRIKQHGQIASSDSRTA